MEEDAIFVLFDLGGNFKECEDDRRGLGLCQRGVLEGVGAQRMMQGIGRTREQQPHSVRQEACGRRAVAVEVILHGLDSIFAIAPGAIEVFVEHLGGGRLKRGHHKAGVIARSHDFSLQYDPPGLCPGPCSIDELVIEAATGRKRLAMGLGQGDPLVLETPCLLDGGSGLTEQDGIASEAKDKIRPAVGRDHVDDLGGSKMTIAADQNMGVGPVAPQIRQQPDQNHGIFGPGRAGARTQVGCDKGMRRPFKNEEWQIAVVLIVMIVERKLLLAIRRIIRVVEIKDNSGRRLGVAGNEMIHKGPREPREVLTVDVVLQARERRGAGSIVGRIQRRPLHPEFEQGVTAETIGVIGVGIPRRDLIDALG